MGSYEGRALVLDAKDYRETSSLVRLLTHAEGRISVVAKGLRKGKGGSGPAVVQPFSLVRVRFLLKDGATLGTLVAVELEHAFPAARTSLEAYALISYWFEILKEASQPRESASPVFDLTLNFLQKQESTPGLSLGSLRELTDLCRLLGFGVSWFDCAACGREELYPSRFSIRNGAVLCGSCVASGHEGLLLRTDEQLVIASLARSETDETGPLPAAALLNTLGLINRYLMYHLEHPLKTFTFVESIFRS